MFLLSTKVGLMQAFALWQAMMFLDASSDGADAFTSKYREVAEKFRSEGINFLVGDLAASEGAFQVGGFSLASFY